MITYNDGSLCVIPLHLNMCFFPELNSRDYLSFLEIIISDTLLNSVSDYIQKCRAEVVVLDFKNIQQYEKSIRPFHRFKEFVDSSTVKVFFINIDDTIVSTICDELGLCNENIFDSCNISLTNDREIISSDSIIKKRLVEILKMITTSYDEELQFLESSSVFSNRYVQVKKLFANPIDYRIVLYELCRKIYTDHFINNNKEYSFDVLLSASTVGSTIATNISTLLGKPAVHIHNLGPRFAIYDYNLENIEANKKYLFLYDFICLGTEFKLVNAIVKMGGGELIGAVGFASLISPNTIETALNDKRSGKMDASLSPFTKFSSLLYVNDPDVNIDYRIFVDKAKQKKVIASGH